MRQVVLGVVLLLMAALFAGCSDSGGTGGTGGTSDGSTTPLSLDENTAIPATAGAANAMVAAAELGGALGTVFSSVGEVAFSESGSQPKQLPPGPLPCSGGGTVEITGDLTSTVEIDLSSCVGLGIADEPVSGNLTFAVDALRSSPPTLFIGGTTLDLDVGSQTNISGRFEGKVDLGRAGSVVLTLGDALDEDRIDATQSGATTLRLGCFEITLFFDFNFVAGGVQLSWITPFSAASIQLPDVTGQQVYTISDYGPRITGGIPQVSFDEFSLPWSGQLTLFAGNRTAIDDNRSTACPGFGVEGDGSTFVATFSQEQVTTAPDVPRGGCIKLTGGPEANPIEVETDWEKLLDGDYSPGAREGCFGEPVEPAVSEGFEGCPAPVDTDVATDAYIRGNGPEGDERDTNFGSASNLLVKSASNNYYTRKTYLGFDLTGAPASFARALVVLTLERHVGRRPIDVYGLPGFSWTEDGITWNNAPANTDAPNGFDAAAERLISSDPLDLEPLGIDDPAGTKYAFDITELVRENAPGGITVMITNPTIENTDGSTFVSRESEDPCNRPFLHFE
jgi:hypothetical protein